MNQYNVYSQKLNDYLASITEVELRNRYQIFFSLHEELISLYSQTNINPDAKLRAAVEALCKVCLCRLVLNAEDLFDKEDKLNHLYAKRKTDCTIEEAELNHVFPKNDYYLDKSILVQLAYCILCKNNWIEDNKNDLYKAIKDGYDKIYAPLNKDADHPVLPSKQSLYTGDTLFTSYFAWVKQMIDICPNHILDDLRDILPFENKVSSEGNNLMRTLDSLSQEDRQYQEFYEFVKEFKHEFGKKYVLVVSTTLREELKKALSNVAWNMIVDFDPNTQKVDGLFNTFTPLWKDKRQKLFTDVETNGDKITRVFRTMFPN